MSSPHNSTNSTATAAPSSARRTSAAPARLAAQAVKIATVAVALNVFVLFISAGQMIGAGASDTVHEVAAVTLHITTAAAALPAVAHRLLGSGSTALAVITVVTFAASFAQAWSAGLGMTSHIPGAFVICAGALGAAVLAFASSPRGVQSHVTEHTAGRP